MGRIVETAEPSSKPARVCSVSAQGYAVHSERATEAAEARRMGGIRRRREGTLTVAYDWESLDHADGIRAPAARRGDRCTQLGQRCRSSTRPDRGRAFQPSGPERCARFVSSERNRLYLDPVRGNAGKVLGGCDVMSRNGAVTSQ